MRKQLWYYFKLECKESVMAYFEPLHWLYKKLKWSTWDKIK
jgi:hypothetical protein